MKLQLEEAFGNYQQIQKIHREQMFGFQNRIAQINKEFKQGLQPIRSALMEFESQNSRMLKSIGAMNNAFELPKTRLLSSLGVLEQFRSQQQGLLSALKTQEFFTEKFKVLASVEHVDSLTESKLEIIDSILDEVEQGIRYHIEAAPDTQTQIPIDRLLSYIGILLTILIFIYSTLTDKSQEILDQTAKIQSSLERRFEQINSRLDSIAEQQVQLALRVCIHGTKIYKRPKSTSTALAFVKIDQVVNVVSINPHFKSKKWVYVTYVDFEFGTPQAGWVMKKYFKNETKNYR